MGYKKLIALIILFITLKNGQAFSDEGFKLELVPYAWLVGIEGDITARGREVEIDADFNDLAETYEVGGSILAVTQYNRWVLFTQVDYFSLDTDNLDDAPSHSDIQSETLFATATFGYQFRTFGQKSTLDVLGGARYLRMENEFSFISNSSDNSNDWVDGIIMLRPNFSLLSWLRFNPTMSVGTGDSEITYELQPQFQFELGDTLVARLGYRRLYYDTGDEENGFEGTFHGPIAGIGFEF